MRAISISGLTFFLLIARLIPASADEPTVAEQAAAAVAKHKNLGPYLPGNPPFQTPDGIQQLALTAAQRKQIQDIGLVFNGKVLDQRLAAAAEEQKMKEKLSGDELENFRLGASARSMKQMEQSQKWAVESRRLVEKILTEKQLGQVRDLEFRQRARNLIHQPQVFADLGLDDSQTKQLSEVRAAHEKKQQELSRQLMALPAEAGENLLKVLTPEQREKLRQKLERLSEDLQRFAQ